MPVTPPETAFLFDLDGTLVDSVYDHVLAWHDALVAEGIELSFWRIHRKIGMSGGLFTNQLLRETGLEISEERNARLRRNHAEAYLRYGRSVVPLPGAVELLAALTANGFKWAIATSGRMETAKLNLDALGVDPTQNVVITRDMVKYAKEARAFTEPAKEKKVKQSDWEEKADDLIKQAEEFAKVAANTSTKQADAKAAYKKVQSSCSSCHEVFKNEE